jgi:hypothetical protein
MVALLSLVSCKDEKKNESVVSVKRMGMVTGIKKYKI